MLLEEIRSKIYHLKFDSQYEVTSTFLRLQEFYESPFDDIRGHFFTLEKYMDIYAKHKGNFTYTLDWNGFNVPDTVVRDFFTLFWVDLLNKEKQLYKTLSQIIAKKNKFYLIATHKEEDLSHEIAHGYYYLYSDYASKMNSIIYSWKSKKGFIKLLQKLGYCDNVINDEIQAYLATSKRSYLTNHLKVNKTLKIPADFSKVFKNYETEF